MAQLQSTGITGSLTVTSGSATEFQVLDTGVRIGNIISDVHTVTGSINISGSVTATNFTGSLFGTASWANNVVSASYASASTSASFATNAVSASFATNAVSSSYALNATSASYALRATSASYAETSSYAGQFNVANSLTASGLIYPTADGAYEFQTLQTNAAGTLSFGDVRTIYETVYNGEATTLIKGTPVYVSGSQGANPTVYRADAGNAAKMPVTYVVAENIATATTGRGIALGLITGVDTTGYPAGTEIYVAVGGGWTSIRPTGSAIIQVLGYVTKEGTGGQGVVLNPGPSSLPNLTSGSAWVGNSSGIPVAVPTSSFSVAFATSASYASSSTSASFATQANSAFTASTADNFTVRGTLTAQTIVAQTITSSTDYVTGSTRFGSLMSNTHQFTGSVSITGSLNVVGTGITGSLLGTASRADNATSASYALVATSASYASASTSASYALTSTSASYAPTAADVFVQGGNSFGAQAVLGTNDVQNLAFETSGSIRMAISGTNGHVGIGYNPHPSIRLNVSGSGNFAGDLSLDGSGNINRTLSMENYAAGTFTVKQGADAGSMEISAGSTSTYKSYINIAGRSNVSAPGIQFGTRTAERMRIADADGNVGIGTTNPSLAKLQIQGNVSASSYTGSLFGTASRADNATSASFASTAVSSSFSSTTVSASFATNAVSASFVNILNQNVIITGSVNVTGSVTATTFTGSLLGTASRADNATSASFASTAVSASFASTAVSASFATNAVSSSFATNAVSASYATTAGVALSGTGSFTGSFNGALTGSLLGTASWANNATTASYALTATSASFASNAAQAQTASFVATASYALNADLLDGVHLSTLATTGSNTFVGTQTITGSINLSGSINASGTITAQTLVVQTITSSTDYVTGSTRFGSLMSNTHQFTGSVSITGSLNVVGTGITGSLLGTASRADNATSASFATNAVSASFATNAVSASFAPTATNVFIQSGNSFGATAVLGTNDLQDLQFETNNAVRMVVSGSNGNIGIGTSSPTIALLDVYTSGQIGSSSLFVLRRAAGYGHTLFEQTYDSTFFANGKTLTLKNDSGTSFAHFAGNNTGTITNLIIPSGSIGIGTTSPTYKLDVNGDVNIGSTNGYYFGGSSTAVYRSSNDIRFYVGSGDRVSITSGGSVGIGTTAPAYLLDVAGVARFLGNATASAAAIFNNPSGNSGTSQYYAEFNAGATVIARMFRGNGTSGVVGNGLNIDNYDGFQIRANQLGGSGGSINLMGGNVGIDTITPVFKLDVYSTSTATARFYNNQATATFEFGSASNSSYANIILRSNSGTGEIFKAGTGYTSYGGASALNIYNSNAGIHFFPNGTGTSVMAITGSNVGIGTTSPAYKLDVSGIGRIYNTTNNAALRLLNNDFPAIIDLSVVTATATARNWAILTNGVNWGDLAFKVSTSNGVDPYTTGSTVLTILSNGNVGIGTTNPSLATLQIQGNVSASSYTGSLFGTSSWAVSASWAPGGASLSGGSTNYVARWASTTTLTTGSIYDTGTNVGIGTTSPATKLHVVGPISVERIGVNVYSTIDMEGNFRFNASSGYAHTFLNNGSELMRIMSSGSVGIGTTSPTAKLEVAGYGYFFTTGSQNGIRVGATPNYYWEISREGISTGYLSIIENYNGAINERIRVMPSGSVGIGTTTPGAKLTVRGGNIDVQESGYGLVTNELKLSDYNTGIFTDGTNGNMTFSTYGGGTGNTFRWVTNVAGTNPHPSGGTTRMVMDKSGNIGIATATPLATLDVEGNLFVRNAQFEATSSVVTGSTTIATIATGSYRAAFVDYVAYSGSNQRAGTFISNWNGSSIQYTDYSTVDIGTTAVVTMSAVISGGNALIRATTPTSWTVTATYRTI